MLENMNALTKALAGKSEAELKADAILRAWNAAPETIIVKMLYDKNNEVWHAVSESEPISMTGRDYETLQEEIRWAIENAHRFRGETDLLTFTFEDGLWEGPKYDQMQLGSNTILEV